MVCGCSHDFFSFFRPGLQWLPLAGDYLIEFTARCSTFTCRARAGGGANVIDWQAIVAEHGPLVWRTAYRLVSHHEDALDCYQETFLRAAQYAQNKAVANWPGLLRQMATGRALDCLRRRYRIDKRMTPLTTAAHIFHHGPSPDGQAELGESIDRLRLALADLPAKQSETFCLREFEQMSTPETAEQLEATPEEVALWLHRAKAKLRQALADDNQPSNVRR